MQKQKKRQSKSDICRNPKRKKGDWGEAVAAHFLKNHDYRIIARNVQYRDGELDLVAVNGGVLFFIEVKTRANEKFGAVEAVHPRKRVKLERARQHFCYERGISGSKSQFDCIVVIGQPGNDTVIVRHYRNCFEG